ncbi:hypothetical protein SDC9_197551 [bioreactor metagenome]|uniref:Uncharacterized protein n=1 Tax=bioreactor metagenome TaxID=1076179 RepID=A0A645IF60_9ZZZZ
MHANFVQLFGNGNLLVLCESHAGLLLAVAQGNVMNLDLIRKIPHLSGTLIKVPKACVPLIIAPGGFVIFKRHSVFPPLY